jgi:hypothetical protein
LLASTKTLSNSSEFPNLAAPQRKLETSTQPLKKPTANHLPVILKSNSRMLQKYLIFSPSSLAYGQFTESQTAS